MINEQQDVWMGRLARQDEVNRSRVFESDGRKGGKRQLYM